MHYGNKILPGKADTAKPPMKRAKSKYQEQRAIVALSYKIGSKSARLHRRTIA